MEATFENWESEFLQMGAYVVLTALLIQKGSPESKNPDGDEVDADPRDQRAAKDAPGPVKRGGLVLTLYEHSLSIALLALFLLSFVLHALGGHAEFGENWGLPGGGLGRNLFEQPLHWEYFYDQEGKALVRLHRILGALRRTRRALNAGGFFYYFNLQEHLDQGVVAYRREADPTPGQAAERLVVALNFSDRDADIWIPFPAAGQWAEQIDGTAAVQVAPGGQGARVRISSNYGAVYELV